MLRTTLKRLVFGKLPIFSGSFPYFGERVFFPKNSHMFEQACKQGVYEKANVDMLLTLARPDTYYFDVGANIGLMSIPVLWGEPGCRVVSFEPSSATAPFLEKTAAASSFSSRWTVVTQALGSSRGTVDFHVATAGMGAFDGFYDTKRSGVPSSVEIVEVTTLDDVWEELRRPPVSVVKIDVEGAELDVLGGAGRCIAAEHPFVLLEWYARNVQAAGRSATDLLDAAGDLGYGIYAVPHGTPVNTPADLSAQMLFTHDFLFIPIRDRPWPPRP